jgi:gas vesicle protein
MMTTYERTTTLRKGLIIGFAVGCVVAGAAALLFAPKSGKDLRGDIRNKSRKLVTDVETMAEKAKATLRETARKVGETESKLVGAVKAGVEAYREKRNADAHTVASDKEPSESAA